MARKYRGSVTVEVEIDDVLPELSDDDVRQEYKERFGAPGAPIGASLDLIAEVHAELLRGKVAAALALLDSAMTAARITDDQRQREYQIAGRASAH